MVSHPEPDILECEIRWVLGSTAVNKGSRYDRIPLELFKPLNMMLSKYCFQYISKPERPSSGHRTGKGQSSFQFPRRAVLKNVQTIEQLYLFAMLVKSDLKFCMLDFTIMPTKNFQMFKLGLEKQRNHGSNCQHSLDHRESKGIPEKHLPLFHQLH